MQFRTMLGPDYVGHACGQILGILLYINRANSYASSVQYAFQPACAFSYPQGLYFQPDITNNRYFNALSNYYTKKTGEKI